MATRTLDDHPPGDALLTRSGPGVSAAISGGAAYRPGGAVWPRGQPSDSGCSSGRPRIRGESVMAGEGGSDSSSRQSTDVLLTVLGERSSNLHDHLSKVAELAEALSRALRLPELDVQWIRLAAKLHDVGKMAIPDAILHKPGPLSDDEWVVMRQHTVIGERIVRSAASLAPAAQLVRSSHERYDGEGYPDGLRGGEIEVGARIIAICDTYDAIVSDRSTASPGRTRRRSGNCAGVPGPSSTPTSSSSSARPSTAPQRAEPPACSASPPDCSLPWCALGVSCSRDDLTKRQIRREAGAQNQGPHAVRSPSRRRRQQCISPPRPSR